MSQQKSDPTPVTVLTGYLGDHQRAWKENEARVTRLVFIGRNLPRDIISDGFRKCRAVRQAAE